MCGMVSSRDVLLRDGLLKDVLPSGDHKSHIGTSEGRPPSGDHPSEGRPNVGWSFERCSRVEWSLKIMFSRGDGLLKDHLLWGGLLRDVLWDMVFLRDVHV